MGSVLELINKVSVNPPPLASGNPELSTLQSNEQNMEIQSPDPRPDLTNDSALWSRLLARGKRKDEKLYGILHGFRSMGTRIKRTTKGGYVIRPDFDSTGKKAWRSQEEYDAAKEKYLRPHLTTIVELLNELDIPEEPPPEDLPPG